MSLLRKLLGGMNTPKAVHRYPFTSTNPFYAGLNQDYRWFRQDELVRKCITTNAYFSTAHGYRTQCPDPELKEKVDSINKAVNMDKILFIAQVKRSIYGSTGFEVVTNRRGVPIRLLPLESSKLKPELSEDWVLTGFQYKGKRNFYAPDEVLYFTNLGLEADLMGISDLEPLRGVCSARHEILRENFSEIARSLWAPYIILKADTSGLSMDEAEDAVERLAEVARAGKSIAINESVEAQVVNITPDIKGLNELLSKLDEAIIAALGTPRFLLGKPIENRATAYAELEAYIEGTVGSIQRYLKRELEHQWYDRLSRVLDTDDQVKHIWNQVRGEDVYRLSESVAKLWGSHGQGPIGGDRDKVWSLMGWGDREDA